MLFYQLATPSLSILIVGKLVEATVSKGPLCPFYETASSVAGMFFDRFQPFLISLLATSQAHPLSKGSSTHRLSELAVGNLVGTLFDKEASQRVKKEWLESQKEQSDEPKAQAENTGPRDLAVRARTASRALQNLTSKQREQLLHKIAENLLAKEAEIMQANDQDCQVSSSSSALQEDSEPGKRTPSSVTVARHLICKTVAGCARDWQGLQWGFSLYLHSHTAHL